MYSFEANISRITVYYTKIYIITAYIYTPCSRKQNTVLWKQYYKPMLQNVSWVKVYLIQEVIVSLKFRNYVKVEIMCSLKLSLSRTWVSVQEVVMREVQLMFWNKLNLEEQKFPQIIHFSLTPHDLSSIKHLKIANLWNWLARNWHCAVSIN